MMPGPNADIFTYAEYGTFEEFIERYGNENINQFDKYGYDLLHYALMGRKFNIAKYLIEKGADVNTQDRKGFTNLHFVCMSNTVSIQELEIAKMLLDRGADVNIKDRYGNNALWTACHYSKGMRYEMVKLLLEYDGDVYSKNNVNKSPLDMAYDLGDKKLQKLLGAYA